MLRNMKEQIDNFQSFNIQAGRSRLFIPGKAPRTPSQFFKSKKIQ